MWKKFIVLSMLVVLSACQTTGLGGNPWSSSYNGPSAQEPPKPLTTGVQSAPVGSIQKEVLSAQNGMVQKNTAANATGNNMQVAGMNYIPPGDETNMPAGPANSNYSATYGNAPSAAGDMNYTAPAPAAIPKLAHPPIKVAILVPLSGPHKDLGQALLQSAQMAMFDMNFNEFELMPRDTAADPNTARATAQSAIKDGADLILGPLFSSSVQAVQPVARRYGVNMIAFSTDWSLAGGNTFIMGFLPFAQVQRVTEYALERGDDKIGIIAPNTDYGNAVIAAYNSLAYRRGLDRADVMRFDAGNRNLSDVVRSFTKYDSRVAALDAHRQQLEEQIKLNPNDNDAKKELAALKDATTYGDLPFNAVLMPVGGDQAITIANLLTYYDLDPTQVRRLGTGLWDDTGLASDANLNDGWFTAPDPNSRTGFEQRFRQLYGYTAPRLATLAYDATALAVVLSRNGEDQLAQLAAYSAKYGNAQDPDYAMLFTKDKITNPNGFAGVDGIFRFRSDGLIERGLAVLGIKDGKISVIDPAPKTFQRPAASSASY